MKQRSSVTTESEEEFLSQHDVLELSVITGHFCNPHRST